MTGLTAVLVLEESVLALAWREDDVTSGDEEEPLSIPAVRDEEAASTLSPRGMLCADRETERSGEIFADRYGPYGGVGSEGWHEELGTGRAPNNRLADLDVDVSDIVFSQQIRC